MEQNSRPHILFIIDHLIYTEVKQMDSLIPLFDPIRGVTMPALLIKIFLAVFFGGLIGLERGHKHRAAGSRIYDCLSRCGINDDTKPL